MEQSKQRQDGKKGRSLCVRNYIIKVLDGMARGLFSSLIIGLILTQIGHYTGIEILSNAGKVAKFMMGPGIGAGVALSLGAPPLAMLSAIVCGALGAGTIDLSTGALSIGDPTGALVSALLATETGKFISGKTKLDIIAVPGVSIIIGSVIAMFVAPYISYGMSELGKFINLLAHLHPIPMGILLSVVMGIILTLPISSAAIAIALGLSGIAAGASTIGCSCQMIGFAVISFKDNGFGALIAQGLGTSMIQIGNIVKNPWIFLPPILSSAILGPIASAVLGMTNTPVGAGMGTSGLVGQIGTVESMGSGAIPMILLMHILLPAVLSYLFYLVLKKMGKIKSGDLALS